LTGNDQNASIGRNAQGRKGAKAGEAAATAANRTGSTVCMGSSSEPQRLFH